MRGGNSVDALKVDSTICIWQVVGTLLWFGPRALAHNHPIVEQWSVITLAISIPNELVVGYAWITVSTHQIACIPILIPALYTSSSTQSAFLQTHSTIIVRRQRNAIVKRKCRPRCSSLLLCQKGRTDMLACLLPHFLLLQIRCAEKMWSQGGQNWKIGCRAGPEAARMHFNPWSPSSVMLLQAKPLGQVPQAAVALYLS